MLYADIFVAAQWIAVFYGDDRLAGVLRLLALAVHSFCAACVARLTRELRFKPQAYTGRMWREPGPRILRLAVSVEGGQRSLGDAGNYEHDRPNRLRVDGLRRRRRPVPDAQPVGRCVAGQVPEVGKPKNVEYGETSCA